MSTFEPMFDYVLISRDEADEVKNSTIFLLEETKTSLSPAKGTVVAVGAIAGSYDTSDNKIVEIKPGDRVIFGRYAGTEIQDGDETYWLVKDTDVLVRITE